MIDENVVCLCSIVLFSCQPTPEDKQRFVLEVMNTLFWVNEPSVPGSHQTYVAPEGSVQLHHQFFGRLATDVLGIHYHGVIEGNEITMEFVKPHAFYEPPPFVA